MEEVDPLLIQCIPVEKHQRTLREHSLPHIQTQKSGGKEISLEMFANIHNYPAYATMQIAQYTLHSFQVFSEEKSCLAQLQQAILQYMIMKEVKSVDLELPGLNYFLSGKWSKFICKLALVGMVTSG